MSHKFKELGSAHWVGKMKTLYRTLDRDGKGYITLRDNQRSPRAMIRAFKLSKDKADAMLDYTRRVGWVKLVNAGREPRKGHRVTQDMFIENMARAVNSSDDIAKDLVKPHVVYLLDLKEEGFITKEDYLKMFNAQLVDEEISKAKFEILDSDKDGCITVEEYTEDVRFFFTNTDDGNDPVLSSSQLTERKPAKCERPRPSSPAQKRSSRGTKRRPNPPTQKPSSWGTERKPTKRERARPSPPAQKKIRLALDPHHITMFGLSCDDI